MAGSTAHSALIKYAYPTAVGPVPSPLKAASNPLAPNDYRETFFGQE